METSVLIMYTHLQVNENTFMAHNGTIDEATPPVKHSEKSDTNWFVEHFMSHFDVTALDDNHFIDMLGNFIGGGPMETHQWYGNKLVFLTADKRTKKDSYVVNEHLGQSPARVSGLVMALMNQERENNL